MLRRGLSLLRCGALFLLSIASAPLLAEEVRLRDERLMQTAAGREQLKYLVNCALPAETTVVAEADGQQVSFPGGMGLAPDWVTRPMTIHEQRRVSACMLARTNFFGVPVEISMRSDAANAPGSLHSDENERRKFRFFEAGFFGNLFQARPEAYVCTGDNPEIRLPHLQSLLRVCSLPMENGNAVSNISRCGFVIAGACKDRPFIQNGVDYFSDVLSVYLPARK